jgi:hypothetical protein
MLRKIHRKDLFWRVVLLFSSAGEQRQYIIPVIFRIVSSVNSIILGGVVSFSTGWCYLLPGVISGGFRLVRGVSALGWCYVPCMMGHNP